MKETLQQRQKNLFPDLVLVLTAFALAILASLVIYLRVGIISITSESMAPVLRTDDIALTIQAPLDSIGAGDIVVLQHPSDTSLYLAHRLVAVDRAGGKVVVETKGDANPVKDGWLLELRGEKVPKVVFSLATSRLPLDREARLRLGQVLFLLSSTVLLFSVARRKAR